MIIFISSTRGAIEIDTKRYNLEEIMLCFNAQFMEDEE